MLRSASSSLAKTFQSRRLLSTIATPVASKASAAAATASSAVAEPRHDDDFKSHRLLQGMYPLDDHTYTPGGLRTLGAVLPNVDLREDFSQEDIEVLQQASHDAGGILIFPNREYFLQCERVGSRPRKARPDA